MIFKLAALGAAGYAGYRYFTRDTGTRNAAFAQGQADDGHQTVRDAGPNAMRDPVKRAWTETDQELDESFPASDPPGNY
ncbi:hypothetical protein [Erythrobacter donghaensis]|uniref:hypothetical protein n=1 Tax=Erythrobacter donghaensis TaxID=267135 RepID=UPI000A369499|nr:hypothetical protein [Erythrobacter donghaensis]